MYKVFTFRCNGFPRIFIRCGSNYLLKLQALLHASIACSLKPTIDWIAASDLEDDSAKMVLLTSFISGGFGYMS